jgi:hypothetical protein
VLDEIDDTMEFIPFGLVDDIFELNGAFEYGRRGRGLRFCEDALYDDDKTCPPDDEVKSCRGSDICTSKCYCTDGMRNTRDNETELVYDMNDVEDQGENPVLTDSQDELEEEADRLASLGDPVTAFLNSDEFTSVDPSAEERSEDGPGDEESEGGSAAGLGASLCALLMAVVASVLSR